MKLKSLFLLLSLFLLALTQGALAQATQPSAQQAPSSAQPTMSDDAFAAALRLDKIRALSVQDRQTLKTWDTLARQTINQIHSRAKFEGRDSLFTYFDIAFVPENYLEKPILRIKNPQFLSDLLAMPGLDAAQRESIEKNKAVSLNFWSSQPVQQFVEKMQKEVIASRDTINQMQNSASLLMNLVRTRAPLGTMAFVPPAEGGDWHRLPELSANMILAFGNDDAEVKAKALPGYDNVRVGKVAAAVSRLADAWRIRDAATAQAQIDILASELPTLTGIYPSEFRRSSEILYNKFYKLTLPGAAIYFVAFVLFTVAAFAKGRKIWTWGIVFAVLGLLLHTLGIAIRWWLDQKSTQSWFYSIPIKNQFESVMFSAWFGMLVGLGLELWKKKGLYGAAASFVGWMSLVALFTVPYVFGKEIGNEIGRVNGILMSYWLYIHVTLACASYALIGMSFLLGVWWLIRYFTAPREVRLMSGHRLSSDAVESEPSSLAMAFATSPVPALAGGAIESVHESGTSRMSESAKRTSTSTSAVQTPIDFIRSQLASLDSCNVVILQLAFWILGIAIVCGAIWADVSWGRPWGWDPKETFALVTWIVYLIILHVRLVTKQKGLWTAILCIVGFFVMLFNWIGVNYFLVGLHSYA